MTQVLINDILPLTQVIATAGQTVYSTDWTANYPSDVVVYSRAAGVAADDAIQILDPTLYTVTFVGSDLIVSLTLVNASLQGDIVTITRMTPADRENLYTNTNFTPSMLNNDFGILTLVDQQNQLVNQQLAPRYNYSETLSVPGDLILPFLPPNSVWIKANDGLSIKTVMPLTQPAVSPIGFIVNQDNALVPSAQSIGDLTTGILKNTTASSVGTLSISAVLTNLDALGIAQDTILYGQSAEVFALAPITAYGRSLIALANSTALSAQLGLQIGVNVQAFNPNLQSISGLGTQANRMIYTTGFETWAETPVTAYSLALLAIGNSSDAATYLGTLPLSGGTLTGPLFLSGPATVGSNPVTLAQAQALFANDQLACLCMTTGDLTGWTYANGSSGVGSTLTAPINGGTSFDGVTPTLNERVFVNLQTSNPAWQGPYTIVQGTGSTPTVLTRGLDYDDPSEMQPGDIFAVVQGTTYGASQWMMSQTGVITIGTTPITFNQITGQGALLKANNLSDLPSAATARTNLGLGTAATMPATAFLSSSTAFLAPSNNLSDVTSVPTARSNLGLGTAATMAATAFISSAAGSVTYSQIQNVTPGVLLGNSSGVAGPPNEIAVGSGLTLSSGTLSSSATASALPIVSVNAIARSNVTGTYVNNSGTNATFTVTGTTLTEDTIVFNSSTIGQTLGLLAQSIASQNGKYALTSVGTSLVFTRTSDYNTPALINAGGFVFGNYVGGSFGQQLFYLSAAVTTIGSSGISYLPASIRLSITSLTTNAVPYFSATGNLNQAAPTSGGILLSVAGAAPSFTTSIPSANSLIGLTAGAFKASGNAFAIFSSSVLFASAINIVSNTNTDLTSIVLPAGNFVVLDANIQFSPSIGLSAANAYINTTSATQPDLSKVGGFNLSSGTIGGTCVLAPGGAFSLTTSTTVYLSAICTITTGTCKISGAFVIMQIG